MSFERPNLHFSVRKKRPNLASNFEELLAEAQRVQQGGGGLADFPPTIVYTLTRREAQDVATALQVGGWGGWVGEEWGSTYEWGGGGGWWLWGVWMGMCGREVGGRCCAAGGHGLPVQGEGAGEGGGGGQVAGGTKAAATHRLLCALKQRGML